MQRALAGIVAGAPAALVRVRGGSMWPLLKDGDTIGIERCATDALRIGDVVTIETASGLLTHRVIAINAGSCRTAGDRWIVADAEIGHAAIVGRVTSIRRADRLQHLDRRSTRWREHRYGMVRRWQLTLPIGLRRCVQPLVSRSYAVLVMMEWW